MSIGCSKLPEWIFILLDAHGVFLDLSQHVKRKKSLLPTLASN
jgi:hypothetical protein